MPYVDIKVAGSLSVDQKNAIAHDVATSLKITRINHFSNLRNVYRNTQKFMGKKRRIIRVLVN